MEQLTVDLRNAGLVPFERGLVPPQSGTISIESHPEARDFARPTPAIDTASTISVPALESANQPLPMRADARIPGPANLWISETTHFTRASQVATGQIVECDLLTTGITVTEQQAPVDSAESMPSAIAESRTDFGPVAHESADSHHAQRTAEAAQREENRPPAPTTKPLPIVPHATVVSNAKPVQLFQATLSSTAKIEIPHYDPLPLRSVMMLPAATPASVKSTAPHELKAASPVVIEASKKIPASAPSGTAHATKPVHTAQSALAAADKPNRQSANKLGETNGAHGKPPAVKPVAGPGATPQLAEAKVSASLSKPAGSPFASLELNLPELNRSGSRLPNRTVLFAASGVAAVLISVLIVFSLKGSGGGSTVASPTGVNVSTIGAGPDWLEDFAPDPLHPRTISLLRSTNSYKDYRIEMDAQIDRNALGWVFRAKDPRNFQVGKIEVQHNGAGMNPFLVHFAVINGVPEPRKQVPLGISVSPSTVYRVRFEVTGNRFTAYVQDRKVDEWSDARLASGGAGLYSDSGERAILESAFNVTPAGKTN